MIFSDPRDPISTSTRIVSLKNPELAVADHSYKQARNQGGAGGRSPLKNVSPPWKNALDIVLKYWT